VTDHDPLDELDDPTLAAALSALAPERDGDPYPAAHRRFVARRRRHRAMTAGAGLVGAAAIVGAALFLGGGPSTLSGVRTVHPAGHGSSTVPAPSTSSSTTTPTAVTPGPTASVPGRTDLTTTTSTTTGSAPTTTPAAAHDETVDSAGGSVRVRIAGTTVTLLSSTPAAGYTTDVRSAGPPEVEVRFRTGSSGGTEHRIRLRFTSDGILQREVT